MKTDQRGTPHGATQKGDTEMKWTKRNLGSGMLGQGYECGEYIICETYNSYMLRMQYGGRVQDYYWELLKDGEPIKYANTAKALKQYVETI